METTIAFRCTLELRRRIRFAAAHDDRRMSEFVIEAIQAALVKKEAEIDRPNGRRVSAGKT